MLLNKPRVETEIYNDRDTRLVQLFAVIKYHGAAFDQELDGLLKSRRTFELFKDQEGLTDIQRAARFLYRQAMGYGGLGETFASGPKGGTRPSTIQAVAAMALRIRERLQSVTIEWLDWEQCIEKYDSIDTFFFCDPPYHDTAGYAVPFDDRCQIALANRLRQIQGKFLVTNSDNPFMRSLYRGLPTTVVNSSLSIERSHGRQLRHLVVANYPLSQGRRQP